MAFFDKTIKHGVSVYFGSAVHFLLFFRDSDFSLSLCPMNN